MSVKKVSLPASVAAIALAVVAGSFAIAQQASDPTSATGGAEPQLPPGWTMEDMQAMMQAGTPGSEHQFLAEGVGEWEGETTMWMAPNAPPINSTCTSTATAILDGRFIKVDVAGDMPGMGPFQGFGLYGFDNVSKQFVSTWIDNMGTGMMTGVGEKSDNGKTLSWKYTANCPIAKKPVTITEVETITGADTKTLEMWGVDPKSGKEFKSMSIKFTRKK